MNNNLSNNPNLQFKGKLSFFQEMILNQDEVPEILVKEKDSLFQSKQIIQIKVSNEVNYRKSILFHTSQATNIIKSKERKIDYSDWSTGILLICFFFISIMHYRYSKRIQQLFKAFVIVRFFNLMARESNVMKERMSLLLFGHYILLLAYFFTRTFFYYTGKIIDNSTFYVFVYTAGGILVYYFFKIFIVLFTGKLFKIRKEASDYILNIFLLGQISGIILLPVSIMITYIPSQIIIVSFAAFYALLYLYRLLRSTILISNSLNVSLYYLIIYLCTLEILPLVLLYRYLSIYIIQQYINQA